MFVFSYFLPKIAHAQAMLEARMGVEELPSWVFFPDKERAEWVNTMLKQVFSQTNLLWRYKSEILYF